MRSRAPNGTTRRAWLALLLLIPFAIGSQRCMLGALGYGGAMRCLAIPTAEAASADAGCCHGPDRTSANGESVPGPPMKSCCIVSAPVPTVPALDAADLTTASFVVADAPEVSRVEDAVAPVVEAAESPPDPFTGPSLHSRAPPRA